MISKLCQKRLNKEIQMYSQENFKFPNLLLRPNYDNLLIWHFIVYDLQDTPYAGGYYFGKIVLPNDYPLKAPDFYFLTPNGRFETNRKICTTFSAYHQDTYTSTWNVLTMMEGMISFMTDEDHQGGIGSLTTSMSQRQTLAQQSKDWNLQQQDFRKVFPDFLVVLN
jgi:ubiquitin-conjugating enzyme E2 J2